MTIALVRANQPEGVGREAPAEFELLRDPLRLAWRGRVIELPFLVEILAHVPSPDRGRVMFLLKGSALAEVDLAQATASVVWHPETPKLPPRILVRINLQFPEIRSVAYL